MSAGQFHIGPQGPGRCNAKVGKCPYSGVDGNENHFDSYEEAEKDFAQRMAYAGLSGFKTRQKNAVNHNSKINSEIAVALSQDSRLSVGAIEQEQLLQKLSSSKELINDEEFEERAAFVENVTARMKQLGYESNKVYQEKIGDKTVYTKERLELHEEIIDHFEAKFSAVPAQKRAYIAGGLGGAGKGSILGELKVSENYATINPDDVKEYMASKELVPKIQGLTQMESSTLVHEEASDISNKLLIRLLAKGKNVNLDTTLGGLASGRRKIETLQAHGYKTRAIFVDITVDKSAERATGRYRRGLDNYVADGGKGIGGRPVPKGVNHHAKDPRHSSQNAENLIQLFKEGYFDIEPKVFNNMGTAPKRVKFSDFV